VTRKRRLEKSVLFVMFGVNSWIVLLATKENDPRIHTKITKDKMSLSILKQSSRLGSV
jgi:hypothetical protein